MKIRLTEASEYGEAGQIIEPDMPDVGRILVEDRKIAEWYKGDAETMSIVEPEVLSTEGSSMKAPPNKMVKPSSLVRKAV